MTQTIPSRITAQHVDSCVISETFTVLPGGRTIICQLTLKNGFTVRGEASVVSIENFVQSIGEQISRENALCKIWELEGYLLRQRLYENGLRTEE